MIKVPLLKDAKLWTKMYTYFRGCDFTTGKSEVDDSRSPDCLNMIADDAGFPEKRVGWRVLDTFSGVVNGLHYVQFEGMARPVIIVHHGTTITAFDFTTYTKTQIDTGAKDGPSVSFIHNGYLYLLDGDRFVRLSYNNGYVMEQVKNVAKTPCTGRGGHYESEVVKIEGVETTIYTWSPCKPYEEPNLLTGTMMNMLAGDGVNTTFWLAYKGCTVSKIEKLVSGTWTTMSSGYTVSEDATTEKTKIVFSSAPAAHPEGAGIDNIRVTFTTSEYTAAPELIEHCTICTQFGYFNDNRIFASGNPSKRNRDWACAVDDPTYWETNQWTDVGSDHTPIMGYLHYGDILVIVKSDDNQDAEIYVRSAAVQSDNTVLYPVKQGVKGVGSVARGGFASLRDDALFYAREGVFAVSGTDASQQRTVQNRSFFVDNKLREEYGKQNAVAAVWGNLFLLAFPSSGHCYVADARQKTPFNESYVYEWFYWDNIPACRFLEFDGNLFFGTTDGQLCRFNSDMKSNMKYSDNLTRVSTYDGTLESAAWTGGDAIKAWWTTRTDPLGTMSRTKTLTKRGCACVLKPVSGSTVDVYVTTDSTSNAEINTKPLGGWDFAAVDFSNFWFGGMGTPQIVPFNSKVKKFQMLQIKFENTRPKESFGIYGVQLQYIVNNYIK